MNEALAAGVRRKSQGFVVQFGKDGGCGFDFRKKFGEERSITRVVVVARDEEEGEAELRGFRTAHIDHALVINEVGEVVVEHVAGLGETAALEIGVQRHGEDVLETVVFGAVIIAVDGTILRVDAAGANHQLLDEGVGDHVGPTRVGHSDRNEIVHLAIPVFGELQQGGIELFGLGIVAAPRVGGIAVAVDHFEDLAILHLRGPMPGLHDETVLGKDVAEDEDFIMRTIFGGHDFAHRGHPSTHEALVALLRAFEGEVLEVLPGMIGSRVSARIDGHGVAAFARADKGVPTGTEIAASVSGRIHWRDGPADFILARIAPGEELVGEEVRSGHADVLEPQAEIGRA